MGVAINCSFGRYARRPLSVRSTVYDSSISSTTPLDRLDGDPVAEAERLRERDLQTGRDVAERVRSAKPATTAATALDASSALRESLAVAGIVVRAANTPTSTTSATTTRRTRRNRVFALAKSPR